MRHWFSFESAFLAWDVCKQNIREHTHTHTQSKTETHSDSKMITIVFSIIARIYCVFRFSSKLASERSRANIPLYPYFCVQCSETFAPNIESPNANMPVQNLVFTLKTRTRTTEYVSYSHRISPFNFPLMILFISSSLVMFLQFNFIFQTKHVNLCISFAYVRIWKESYN